MRIYALSDPHLSLSTPDKAMAVFGEHWANHPARIAKAWKDRVKEEDVVLVAGDISWAMRLENAMADLLFIAGLPGRKVLLKGNHDFWWSSASRVRSVLPDGMYIIQNDAFELDGVAFSGSRLWVDHTMGLVNLPQRCPDPGATVESPAAPERVQREKKEVQEEDERIFVRELNRLEMSLGRMDPDTGFKVAMVHYPPISTDFERTRASTLLEAHGIRHCVFGHLHNLVPSPGVAFLGAMHGVSYHLTSCDYLDFIPALVAEV
jgi:predicted phosphohydrolase